VICFCIENSKSGNIISVFMNSTIKIGLTYTGSDEKHGDYVNWLNEGAGVDVIKLSAEEDNLDLVKEMDAVVISGGVDAHPKNYGSSFTNYPNAPEQFNEKRDEFENRVFEQSLRHHLPVLGICRGMQLINCLLGGNLTQDLGEEKNKVHHKQNGIDTSHGISIYPHTLLAGMLPPNAGNTNSAHHQSLNKLAADLKINALSDDGIIEGVEWKEKTGKPFLLGIQWHPERMYKLKMQQSAFCVDIRKYFMDMIQKHSRKQ
jgi:putative glutamine amidotransferase